MSTGKRYLWLKQLLMKQIFNHSEFRSSLFYLQNKILEICPWFGFDWLPEFVIDVFNLLRISYPLGYFFELAYYCWVFERHHRKHNCYQLKEQVQRWSVERVMCFFFVMLWLSRNRITWILIIKSSYSYVAFSLFTVIYSLHLFTFTLSKPSLSVAAADRQNLIRSHICPFHLLDVITYMIILHSYIIILRF
jgi:hypothetical protein